MKNIGKWVLGAAVMAGALGTGATKAQAADVWIGGYMNHGYWVPGRWEFRGYRDRNRFADYHRDRDDRFYRDRDDRHFDRGHDWDRDHFRR